MTATPPTAPNPAAGPGATPDAAPTSAPAPAQFVRERKPWRRWLLVLLVPVVLLLIGAAYLKTTTKAYTVPSPSMVPTIDPTRAPTPAPVRGDCPNVKVTYCEESDWDAEQRACTARNQGNGTNTD